MEEPEVLIDEIRKFFSPYRNFNMRKYNGRLDNKVAVVTGASNPSLGRAMSIAFAREVQK